MITSLYSRYFQKSRSFLFPALGISKRNISPLQTYMALDGRYTPADRKLICLFDHEESLKYEQFENTLLFGNPLYHDSIITPGKPSLYIFNFEVYKDDWDTFLTGRYSQLSPELKSMIKNYYGDGTKEYEYIDTYLFPNKYFDLYSQLLDVRREHIEQVGELCDQYDLEKETLIYSTDVLEMSQ